MGLDFFPFVLILAIWECQHSPFLGIPLVGDRPPSFLFFRAGTFLRSGVFAYLTGHPRREPGDECKSRRKKTEFSFCLSAAGKIKRSWDFETKEASGGSPGSFTSTYKVGAQAKYKGENLRCNSNIKSALAKGTEKS